MIISMLILYVFQWVRDKMVRTSWPRKITL